MLEKIFKSRKKKVAFLRILDYCSYKNNSKILVVIKHSVDFSGNLRILLEELEKFNNNFDIYLYKDGVIHEETKNYLRKKDIHILEGFNFISIYHIITSGVVIVGHTIRDAYISKRCPTRLIINLWHGVIFKNIELLMKNLTQDKKDLILENSKIYNLLIASSKVDKISMEKAFAVDREKVVVTGLLRYEILKNNYKVDDQSLQNEINLIKSIKGTKKLVLYAPTFRELDYNILENLNLKLISEFTENNNFIFCIRLHPYSKQIHLDKIYKNVFFINNDICKETNILLKYTDLLVVDYSSIWIDFLLLNKPIIMYSPDITTYMTKERDLAYDINKIIDFNIYYDFNEFFKEMLFLLKNNEINYNHTKTIFHQYDLNFDFRLKFINTFKYKYQEFLK